MTPALWAAALAKRGVTGPPNALEGDAGLFREVSHLANQAGLDVAVLPAVEELLSAPISQIQHPAAIDAVVNREAHPDQGDLQSPGWDSSVSVRASMRAGSCASRATSMSWA
mgnify:CR=1 FL=1